MFKKVIFALAAVGVVTASAATAPRTYSFSLTSDVVVEGKALKAGTYSIELKDKQTAVVIAGSDTVELTAYAVNAHTKFSETDADYAEDKNLTDLRIGGTKTMIVFGEATETQNDSSQPILLF